ncbi:MAG: metallophosphoesterase [Caldibacillus debilis]|jgi:predicted MPP superfamily phosphohydrolase|uniref:Metallophosphoesterase n=1 Tax=Caldibacillus debilis TaxID=301148 RepID=A0A3E0K6N0_9BACI|nr:metallophosphoesterase [Caldibacillus debilis]MBO2480596.1 metallophosphoesterase [Bacillaceae bacterium]MBY6272292.1 metallophosphoesterase [Bacillaceae bacterium]OUM84995.1 MAG: metallophosphoesterase [Caldibacillus debilis]REJ15820.1 MAG: metallophosphoesterase [Caldibacillus debilis]REJ27911.1 MAG: metallophosphoesterase [Caldibacillus debilis]
MPKKMTRRTFLKTLGKTGAFTLLAGLSGYYYSKHIEPYWTEITRFTIRHKLIPADFRRFKIALFSDTHLGYHYQLSHLRKAVSLIMEENPDMIIFSGDLMDNPSAYHQIRETVELLRLLDAPFGKFAVFGNHDHGGYGTEKYRYIMEESRFKVLQNTAVPVAKGRSFIFLAGVDDCMLGRPDLKAALARRPGEVYTILISHAPDYADVAKGYPVHLQISGHSHGGQIQIPFVGPVITPRYGRKYVEGLYALDGLTLYVNRGLGTTRLPFRFLSRPEITFFTLEPE